MKVEKTIKLYASQAETKKLRDFMEVIEEMDEETYDAIKEICGCNLYQALDSLYDVMEIE